MKEQRPISVSVPMMESHSACGREHMHPCDNTTVTGTEKKKTKERIESPNVSRTPRSRRMRIRASCQILNELAQLKCVGYEGGVKEPSFWKGLSCLNSPRGLLSPFRAQETRYAFEEIAYRPVAKQSGHCMVN